MNSKRVLPCFCFILVIFNLCSCKSNGNKLVSQETTTVLNNIIAETVVENVVSTDAIILDTTSEHNSNVITQTTSVEAITIPVETEPTTTESYDEPSNWSKERIVAEYINAAKKSSATAKSTQVITMKEIKVNNGENEKMMSFIKSIIAKFLESNSNAKNGITGGYENLVLQDVNSAKAHKSGDCVAIEMIMVEQTAGANEDALSGSVGHAITTVGDISSVVNDLNERGLSLELSANEDDTKIYYTNPVVNVVINDNGEIVDGTWSYTVEIRMSNLKVFGKNVDKAEIVMENIITV